MSTKNRIDAVPALREVPVRLPNWEAAASPADYLDLAGQLSPWTLWRRHEPLARRTTLRVGGKADFYVEPASEAELGLVLRWCHQQKRQFFLLGRGSNLLVKDQGYRGVVICLAHPAFSRLEIEGPVIRAGAGARMRAVAVEAKRHGLSGLEFLEGIPGTVGGGLRMNAGAMERVMSDAVEHVRFMDYAGGVWERPAIEVPFFYRRCELFETNIALGAVFRGREADPATIAAIMRSYSEKRWVSQPPLPSAGCMFKNPLTVPAGRLIEELGLKGTQIGGAEVSRKHGNFIINNGGATAQNVLDLIDRVRGEALDKRGIPLELEVEIIGG